MQPAPPGGPSAEWLIGEAHRLIDFARASRHPDGGFGWLDDDGALMRSMPRETYMTCRMTHVFALGQLLGRGDCAELVSHGVAALQGALRDPLHGGWLAAVDGAPGGTDKAAYTHSFVVLAASSATVAGDPQAGALLREALDTVQRRFWDEDAGLVVDVRSRDWSSVEPYRGANANMHMVEALLAAADATGDPRWREWAGRIVGRMIDGVARERAWRLPEHFDEHWRVLPDYNRDAPAHPFRPYGVTIGDLLEWSRLCLQLRAAGGTQSGPPASASESERLLADARALFDLAVRDGWAVDGRPGFVYTTDWAGRPVVWARLHWVAAEAIAAAAGLWRVTGEERYAALHASWWTYAREHMLDLHRGSWRHELDPSNRPAAGTWSGKPDAYHAVQAALLPMLPLAPSIALAIRRRGSASDR